VLVTRFAPTPSGYLHVGNLVNLTLTQWLASAGPGRLLLRIDDFDRGRVRPAYLDDIFRTLDWLQVEIHVGPASVADFHSSWSMASRMHQFRAARDDLLRTAGNRVFVCRCSRAELAGDGRCVAQCAHHELELVPGHSVLRLSGAAAPPGSDMPGGDPVLWRRDDVPAYHLGSVVADEALGITAVVRGADLRASSRVQRYLARILPAPGFAAADLRHHDLLTDPAAGKLSKSAGAQAQPLQHSDRLRHEVYRRAAQLGAPLGIERP
jgi:glutamyl-tRNA synthetase